MRIAVVTSYPPGSGTLNEYGYHFVHALRAKEEVSEVLLLVDHLDDDSRYAASDESSSLLLPHAAAPNPRAATAASARVARVRRRMLPSPTVTATTLVIGMDARQGCVDQNRAHGRLPGPGRPDPAGASI